MSSVDGSAVIVELLTHGHGVRFPAAGDSMYPLIRDGDVLHVTPVDVASVRRGEVVLVTAPRGLTAHRVVRVDGDTVHTRGDHAAGDDHPAGPANVVGRVAFVERAGTIHPVRPLSGFTLRAARLLERVRMRLT